MKAALYIRVSTEEQNVANQLPALEALAKNRGFEVVEVYQEAESAWRNGHQAELSRLLSDATKRRFEVVLVWALDRLTREGPLAILLLVRRLQVCGVQVISHQEPWTEYPSELQPVLYSLYGWIAEQESQRRSERTKAGMARARREGKPIGKRGPDKRRRKRRGAIKRGALVYA